MILREGITNIRPFPIIRDDRGTINMSSVGPEHGRSFVLGRTNNDRYVVSKGNGLSYTEHPFINTKELGTDIWGLLLEEDAIRDFSVGMEVESLGIKSNHMEYVLKLDYPLTLTDCCGEAIHPVLLQYDVECPYRISDFGFIPKNVLHYEVTKWDRLNNKNRSSGEEYLIAADVLVNNLRTLHQHNILHNAISAHNYTWALELLDFELASSPAYPYTNEDHERHKCQLYDREIIHTYQVIVYIARALGQHPDHIEIEKIFIENGFDLAVFSIETNN